MKAEKIEHIDLNLSFDEYGVINVVLGMFTACNLNEKLSDPYIPFNAEQMKQVNKLSQQLQKFKTDNDFLALDDE